MRSIFYIIPAALMIQIAGAQNGPSPLTVAQGTLAAVSVTPSTPPALNEPLMPPASPEGESIMDYKSVYEAATLEEEVQLAAQRFNLSKSQQDVWSEAAFDRRLTEKQFRDKWESKATDMNKDAMYRGLRTSQNTFYEIVIGYLSPAQKQGLEMERAIMHEKQRRLAKIPPPVVVPTVTVAPVDSTLIKEQILKEAEKIKAAEKKSKKNKKKPGA